MRTILPILLSSLAAVAGAQNVVLTPSVLLGYRRYAHQYDAARPSPSLGATTLGSDLDTASAYSYNPYTIDLGYRGGREEYATWYKVDVDARGWFTEFALPKAQTGARLVSAILSANASGVAQPLRVAIYAGDGEASVGDATRSFGNMSFVGASGVAGPNLIDVTSGIRSLLGQNAVYAGLRVERSGFAADLARSGVLGWSSPTLTLVYAPVPEPASIAALGVGVFALLRRRNA